MTIVIKGLEVTNATENISLEYLEVNASIEEIMHMSNIESSTTIGSSESVKTKEEPGEKIVKEKNEKEIKETVEAQDLDLIYKAYVNVRPCILSSNTTVCFFKGATETEIIAYINGDITNKVIFERGLSKEIFDRFHGCELLDIAKTSRR